MRINNQGKKIIILLFISAVVLVSASIFILNKREAKANRIILKSNDLYFISDVLGEKKLTNSGDIKFLFDHKNGQILFGKSWVGESVDSERRGGARLFVMKEDGTGETAVTEELVTESLFNNTGSRIFFITLNKDLYAVNTDNKESAKLNAKAMRLNLSSDGKQLAYQKLNSDWKLGDYYDKALGIVVLDITANKEKEVTNSWEDFNPMWTPDGSRILFFSRSPEGLASHFIINSDGSGRKQLTNIGERFVSDKTVDIPSERPIWSSDGKYLVYESDKKIWVNEFNPSYENIVSAKQIAFGKNPQWVINGKIITVMVANAQNADESMVKIDLTGKIVK